MLTGRGIGHEDADLAIVHLALPPEPLPLHAHRGGALLGEPRGVEDDHPVGPADVAAHLGGQLAKQRAMVPGRGADEVLQAVPFLVVAVGDRLGALPLQIGDEPGEIGPGMVALFPARQALGERSSELGEALDAPLKDLWADLALVEQLLLAESVTPVHRWPPGTARPRRKAFLQHTLATFN